MWRLVSIRSCAVESVYKNKVKNREKIKKMPLFSSSTPFDPDVGKHLRSSYEYEESSVQKIANFLRLWSFDDEKFGLLHTSSLFWSSSFCLAPHPRTGSRPWFIQIKSQLGLDLYLHLHVNGSKSRSTISRAQMCFQKGQLGQTKSESSTGLIWSIDGYLIRWQSDCPVILQCFCQEIRGLLVISTDKRKCYCCSGTSLLWCVSSVFQKRRPANLTQLRTGASSWISVIKCKELQMGTSFLENHC